MEIKIRCLVVIDIPSFTGHNEQFSYLYYSKFSSIKYIYHDD